MILLFCIKTCLFIVVVIVGFVVCLSISIKTYLSPLFSMLWSLHLCACFSLISACIFFSFIITYANRMALHKNSRNHSSHSRVFLTHQEPQRSTPSQRHITGTRGPNYLRVRYNSLSTSTLIGIAPLLYAPSPQSTKSV